MRAPILSYTEGSPVDFLALAACSEFPNDNPALHGGAIWVGATLGEPYCETRQAPTVGEREPATDPTPPVIEADDESDDIEIVDEIAIEDPIDESPAPVEAVVAHAEAASEPEAAPGPEPLPAVEATAEIDPFALFVQAMEDVARSAGAGDAAMATLAMLLGRSRLDASATDADRTLRAQALAWQGILRGESEDFSACGGGMLDEWAAALVGHVLQMRERADGFKRDLRRRGVAAFGLVDQAA